MEWAYISTKRVLSLSSNRFIVTLILKDDWGRGYKAANLTVKTKKVESIQNVC